MFKKYFFSLLWPLGLLCLQGCHDDGIYFITSTIKSEVTITLDEKPVTLHFSVLDLDGDTPKYFREFLEKLERGDIEALKHINKPLKSFFGDSPMPLEEAMDYDLGHSYRSYRYEDQHFYATRYLLSKGADPNIVIHKLCTDLLRSGATGKRGLVLLLSYGARLDIKDKKLRGDYGSDRYTPLQYLEMDKPWIPEELRKKYYEEAEKKSLPSPKQKPTSPAAIAAEEAAAALRRSAWKTAISPTDQAALKKEYFTDIADQLINSPQRNRKRLNKSFVKYLKRAGVDPHLVDELAQRTRKKSWWKRLW